MKKPPATANWLLRALAPSVTEALTGDLQEAYQQDRSQSWYWRQVFNTIVWATLKQVRSHPLLACRAIAIGWTSLLLCFWYVLFPLANFDDELFVRGVTDIRRWWPNFPMFLVVLSLGCAASGWIVSRFHMREMLLPYTATVIAWHVAIFPRIVYANVTAPSAPDFLAVTVIYFVLIPSSIMLGGMAGRHGSSERESG